jgi:signal transduction histidine kinase/YHS domain-containing protein
VKRQLFAAGLVAGLVSQTWMVLRVLLPVRKLARQVEQLEQGELAALHETGNGMGDVERVRRSMASMADHVRRAQEQTHTYADALTEGQEAERARIAQELHDETIQALIGIGQGIDLAAHWINGDPQRGIAMLKAARGQVTDTVDSLRRLIGDLRPPALDELGLAAALRMLAGQAVQVAIEGVERRLDTHVELGLFRIAQEALRNAERHSRASQIEVKLLYQPDAVRLLVSDNGVGFSLPHELETLAESGHYGLIGVRERAVQLKGASHIRSAPGHGTTVEVDIPFAAQAQPGDVVRDPVCSALIQPQRAYGSAEYEGQRYYFCCPVCLGAFKKHPEVYLPS